MLDLTVIILTYNEEKNIEECINSVKGIAESIYVVDSFSSDKTVLLAEKCGAKVIQNTFINQSKQFKHAMNVIPINTKWVLRLDADERFTAETSEELGRLFDEHDNDDINGIVLRFEVVFLGKKLKHGGVYPFSKMSVYRNGFADIEDKEMDEHFYLLSGKSVAMKNDCIHNDYKDLSSWIEKHNKYSTREAESYLKHSKDDFSTLDPKAKANQRKKYGFYYKLPAFFRAYAKYFYGVVFKFAWLDGRPGMIYAFLHSYWYRYLVDAKLLEAKESQTDE